MKKLRDRTIKYYDDHAAALRAQYEGIGTREGDIALAFALMGNIQNARVLELGCGYGREVRGIIRRTSLYTGVDASREFIRLARQNVPEATFIEADIVEFDYPGPYDIIFAFAPFRHLDQEEVTAVLRKMYASLEQGGIVYISCNYGQHYEEYLHEDSFGLRLFYLYNPSIIMKLAGPGYRKIHETSDTVGGVRWFEVVLQKAY